MIQKIKENIWQFTFTQFGSCVYLIKINKKNIMIDTGSEWNKYELIDDLKKLQITPSQIDILILTHNHPDHTGNINLLEKAKVYGSKKDFSDDFILNINNLNIPKFKIIETPGHSKGGICILYEDVLFSGDTIFHNGGIGRMDLQGGSESEMRKSLSKLEKINYKILCPGHI